MGAMVRWRYRRRMQRWSVVPTELKKDSRQGEGEVASEITIAVAVLCHIKRMSISRERIKCPIVSEPSFLPVIGDGNVHISTCVPRHLSVHGGTGKYTDLLPGVSGYAT